MPSSPRFEDGVRKRAIFQSSTRPLPLSPAIERGIRIEPIGIHFLSKLDSRDWWILFKFRSNYQKREIYTIRYVYNFFYNLFIISRTNQVFYFFLYLPVLEHLKKSFVEVYIYEYMNFFRRTNYFFFFQAKLFDVRGIIIKIIY